MLAVSSGALCRGLRSQRSACHLPHLSPRSQATPLLTLSARASLPRLAPVPTWQDCFDLDDARRSYFSQLFPLNPGGIVPSGPTLADLRLDSPPARGPQQGAFWAAAEDRRPAVQGAA